jgi:hypothetical protein
MTVAGELEVRPGSGADLPALVSVLGHRRLAMGVGVDNPDARRLYLRLGYADWGHGTVEASWQEHDQTGHPVTVSETIHMLVRNL